jgi:hypothetical protein
VLPVIRIYLHHDSAGTYVPVGDGSQRVTRRRNRREGQLLECHARSQALNIRKPLLVPRERQRVESQAEPDADDYGASLFEKAERLRQAIAKSDEAGVRTRGEMAARDLELEGLAKTSGYHANRELVEQAQRIRKQEAGGRWAA